MATLPVIGDIVEITGIMPNDPAPLEIGDHGPVTFVNEPSGQFAVNWASGRRLFLLKTDPFRIAHPKEKNA